MSIQYKLGNIKLISIDLDGTLLTKFKKITKTDLEALKTFSDLGGEIFINTGKSLGSTFKHINRISGYLKKDLKFFSCLNGNLIFNNISKKIVHMTEINVEDCKQVFEICKKNKIAFFPYTPNNVNRTKKQSIFSNVWKKYVAHVKYDYLKKFDNITALKINLLSIWKKINSDKVLKELSSVSNVETLETNPKLFEVVKKGSNKGLSLEIISNYFNLKKDEIAAIGDSANDVPMFLYAGESYLIKDKFANLKKVASVSFNTKKNGVSKVIYNYLLESNNKRA